MLPGGLWEGFDRETFSTLKEPFLEPLFERECHGVI